MHVMKITMCCEAITVVEIFCSLRITNVESQGETPTVSEQVTDPLITGNTDDKDKSSTSFSECSCKTVHLSHFKNDLTMEPCIPKEEPSSSKSQCEEKHFVWLCNNSVCFTIHILLSIGSIIGIRISEGMENVQDSRHHSLNSKIIRIKEKCANNDIKNIPAESEANRTIGIEVSMQLFADIGRIFDKGYFLFIGELFIFIPFCCIHTDVKPLISVSTTRPHEVLHDSQNVLFALCFSSRPHLTHNMKHKDIIVEVYGCC